MREQPSMPRVCERCGGAFLATVSKVKRGKARFCSRPCYGLSLRRTGELQTMDDGTVRIVLRNRAGAIRAYALVDAADAEFVGQWSWYLGNRGYAVRAEGTRLVLLHRQLLGLTPGDGYEGDHINRDRLDDRRSNLRVLDHQTNPQNQSRKHGSSSRFRGVSWDKEQRKWSANITVQGKRKRLGRFRDELDAARVARAARLEAFPHTVEDEAVS